MQYMYEGSRRELMIRYRDISIACKRYADALLCCNLVGLPQAQIEEEAQ
jgi:hypothetical protein